MSYDNILAFGSLQKITLIKAYRLSILFFLRATNNRVNIFNLTRNIMNVLLYSLKKKYIYIYGRNVVHICMLYSMGRPIINNTLYSVQISRFIYVLDGYIFVISHHWRCDTSNMDIIRWYWLLYNSVAFSITPD